MSNGDLVDGLKWNDVQSTLGQAFPLPEEPNVRVIAWIMLCAQEAKNICDEYNVPVNEFEEKWKLFQNRLVPHIENLRHFLGERERRRIDIQEVIETIDHRIDPSPNGRQLIIRFVFPNLDHPESPHNEEVRFDMEMFEWL